MIYILECSDGCIYEPESLFDAWIDPARLKKVNAYRFASDRMLSRLAFLLLRYAFWNEYGTSILPKMLCSQEGKPYFVNSNVKFNISHTKNGVICSLSDTETGTDIESTAEYERSVAERVMSVHELEMLRIAEKEERDKLFTMLWTAKEAYGKYLGCGLLYDLKDEEFAMIPKKWNAHGDAFIYSEFRDKYAFSVVCGEATRINFVTSEELVGFLTRMEMEKNVNAKK